MATRPHSEHSLRAIKSRVKVWVLISNKARGSGGATSAEFDKAIWWMSDKAVTALATT